MRTKKWGVTQFSWSPELMRGQIRSELLVVTREGKRGGEGRPQAEAEHDRNDRQCFHSVPRKAGPCSKPFLITITPGGRPTYYPQFTERKRGLREAEL